MDGRIEDSKIPAKYKVKVFNNSSDAVRIDILSKVFPSFKQFAEKRYNEKLSQFAKMELDTQLTEELKKSKQKRKRRVKSS